MRPPLAGQVAAANEDDCVPKLVHQRHLRHVIGLSAINEDTAGGGVEIPVQLPVIQVLGLRGHQKDANAHSPNGDSTPELLALTHVIPDPSELRPSPA